MTSGGLYPRVSRLAFRFVDPERAHGLAVRALDSGLVRTRPVLDRRLRVQALGLDFPNPLGMAAGFDKNAEVPGPLLKIGFGFAEIGTVTPLAQPGNPQPRLFRLPADAAVINRLGFNNEGHGPALARLSSAQLPPGGIVGVNVGANKDAEDRVADYVAGITAFAGVASYFTVNVSSPNTPGLRDLQAAGALRELLTRSIAARDAAADGSGGRRVPVLLKLAPDLDETALGEAVEVALVAGVDGLVISNTTLSRSGLSDPQASEAGGMSGVPLFKPSTAMLARVRQLAGAGPVLVGVGGIATGDQLFEKLRAGATLTQLYTGFVFGGPGTAARVLRELLARMDREGVASVSDVTGSDTDAWAARWRG